MPKTVLTTTASPSEIRSRSNNLSKRHVKKIRIPAEACVHKATIASIVEPKHKNIHRVDQEVRNDVIIRVYTSNKGRSAKARTQSYVLVEVCSFDKAAVARATRIIRRESNSICRMFVACPEEAQRAVTGDRNRGLKNIQRYARDGTYIMLERKASRFKITSRTTTGMELAAIKIRQAMKEYFAAKKARLRRHRRRHVVNTKARRLGTRYDLLMSDSDSSDSEDEDEGEDEGEDELKLDVQAQKLGASTKHTDKVNCAKFLMGGPKSKFISALCHQQEHHTQRKYKITRRYIYVRLQPINLCTRTE